jgi:hypothetical protein
MAILGIGRYVVRGIAGTVNYTGLITTSNKVTSLTYKKSFGVTEHRDGMGSVFAVTAGEPVEEIQVTITPIAPLATATIDGAKASVVVPDPLSTVAVAGFPGGIASANYVYVDGDIRLSTDGTPEIQCTIRKYVDAGVGGTVQNFS